MLYVAPGSTFEAVLSGAPTGLTGTLGVRLLDNAGAEALARTTSGITEFPAGSGVYSAVLTAPSAAGQYSIMWDPGSVAPETVALEDLFVTNSAPVVAIPTPPDPPATYTVLDWLRRILEDVPRIESDSGAGDGVRTDFFVSNPPITNQLAVAIDGTYVLDSTYTLIDVRGIRFNTAPADGTTVRLEYTTSTWPDGELGYYIEQAQKDWNEDRDVVYQAAYYAIDTLLVGLAASLEFGAGAEQFNLPGVFERLRTLQQMFLERLQAAEDRPSLEILEVLHPSRDPGYPGGYYGSYYDDIDYGA